MKYLLVLFLISGIFVANAQVADTAHEIVDTLTSSYFWGRGYTRDGLQRASDYLSGEFARLGIQPLKGKKYQQDFTYSVNTFPNKVEVKINGKALTPGTDFIVGAESRGVNTTVDLVRQDSTHFVNAKERIIVAIEKKLTWSVSTLPGDYTLVVVDGEAIDDDPKQISINLVNKFVSKFRTANICGIIPGTLEKEKIIAITAHYDHLGGMGSDTYFPGANDNASGIAMLLSLAGYYTENPPPYSVMFICFSGEEAGLIGSKFFTENPLVPLDKIKFLVNLDLVGTGDEGITVVNASVHQPEFASLKKINDSDRLISTIKSRGKAANSDHFWFTEKGVPAFFIYTLGGIKAYHDVFDRAATLPCTEFDDLYKLIIKFNAELMSGK